MACFGRKPRDSHIAFGIARCFRMFPKTAILKPEKRILFFGLLASRYIFILFLCPFGWLHAPLVGCKWLIRRWKLFCKNCQNPLIMSDGGVVVESQTDPTPPSLNAGNHTAFQTTGESTQLEQPAQISQLLSWTHRGVINGHPGSCAVIFIL